MVAVVMTTYFPTGVVGEARTKYACKTLRGLVENLHCDNGLRLHIADDSEYGNSCSDNLCALAAEYWESKSTHTNSNHHGIGASLNLALEAIDEPWMYITDDWLLTDFLNLDGPLKLITALGYDLVRLGPVHPNLTCCTRFSETIGWWLDIQQFYGGFAFATRPFLASKEFYTKIGPFDENLNAYETERLYAQRVAKSTVKLAYWGGVDLAGPWEHIGIENVGYKEI